MPERFHEPAVRMVEAFGGYRQTVDIVMELCRDLWEVSLAPATSNKDPRKGRHFYRDVDLVAALVRCGITDISLQKTIAKRLRDSHLSGGLSHGLEQLTPAALQPLTLLRRIISGVRPDHDLRYFAMSNVRRTYSCLQSSRLAQAFQILANEVNSKKQKRVTPGTKDQDGNTVDYRQLLSELNSAIHDSITADNERDATVSAFIECCRIVNYFQVHARRDKLIIRSDSVDSAFLLSNLFGMATNIIGFDELFGGGGIILADQIVPIEGKSISGRSILTVGRYGTGKSLLSMQFALSVAEKGGIAYILAVEQNPEEYLYGITSVCTLPTSSVVQIATDLPSAMEVARKRQEGRGAIVIINPLKESFRDFLASVKNDLDVLGGSYPIKLIVIDPISAIKRDLPLPNDARAETLELLADAKREGWNAWLVAEEPLITESGLAQEQNIADTVIRLSVDHVAGYTQRYFEITKSRFQREQRGRHAFSIIPGEGVRIYPSSAAVSARIKHRSIRPPDLAVRFGLKSLDDILGDEAIRCGDVIVLQGPASTYKTPVGMSFLFGVDQIRKGYTEKRRTHSLLVSARDNPASLRQVLRDRYKQFASVDTKSFEEIRICPIAGGYIKPGYILQLIEEEFLAARISGYAIDRVMVDNLGHWNIGCPFIRQDDTFGDTLVDLLRRHQVTSLITCNDFKESDESVLQRTIVDNADCLIRFQRFDFRGERVMARVIKTRSMQHRRGSFEVVTGPRKIDVDERPSLLRISANGEVKSISVRLFLHHENIMQEEYNLAWVSRLRYVLSPDITIDPQDSTSFLKRMKWAKTPTNDELQISQIDEYQLPEMRDGYSNSSLCTFERKDWRRQWDDLLPRILGKIKGSKGEFCAIPFFVNISLLGYRKYFSGTNGVMTIPIASDWKALSDQCAVWEDEHPDTKLLFFDFPGVTDENYNCLFLEILLGYGQPALDGGDRGFVEWLQSEDSKKSCILFRKLCRRAHLKKKYALENASSGITDNRAILVDSEAIVWRLWYSSANQLFASLPADRRNELCITSLPNENAIAGEWYLALPTYSSASEVGMHVIEMLTTHEEELARLRSGVGLPTRKSFYSVGDEKDIAAMVSPYFSISRSLLRKLVNEAFDRSSIPCYTQVSAILASHLRRIIEIEESKDNTVEETIHGILSELESQLRFVESDLPLINGDPTH